MRVLRTEDLQKIRELMSSPVPCAIWFVDAPDAYCELMKPFRTIEELEPAAEFPWLKGQPSFMGLPVRLWENALHQKGEALPPFAESYPVQEGVYIEMVHAPTIRLESKFEVKRLVEMLTENIVLETKNDTHAT